MKAGNLAIWQLGMLHSIVIKNVRVLDEQVWKKGKVLNKRVEQTPHSLRQAQPTGAGIKCSGAVRPR